LRIVKALLKQLLNPSRSYPKRIGEYLIAANELGQYCIPRLAAHRPACQAILSGEVWEAETIRFLCDHADGAIIHGGTFFGDFLPALGRACDQVWAFEPNPDSFKCAEITIRLNDLRNVTVMNVAMGRGDGTATLITECDGKYLGGGSYIVEGHGSTQIRAIDAVIPRYSKIGAIHLDVERSEGPALDGARQTIEKWKPIIVLETVPPNNFLAELGYRQRRLINGNRVFTI